MNNRMSAAVVVAPAFVACLLLGAHVLRLGHAGLAACCLGLAALGLTRQAFARLVLCAGLLAAVPVWLDVAVRLVGFRMAAGLPWMRLAAIMSAVVAVTAGAALLLASARGERRYGQDPGQAWPKALAFLLTAAFLGLAHRYAPLTVLLAERFVPGAGWPEIFLLALYAAWVCGRMLDPRGAAAVRPAVWRLFSAVFFGQLLLGLAGAPHMLMTGALHLPVPALIAAGPLYRGQGFFMLGLFAVSVLLLGPAWCSHLCYIGAWDDAASRLGPRPPARRWTGTWAARAALAALVLGAAWAFRRLGWPQAAAWSAAGFGAAGVAVMAAASRRRGMMVHCTAFCPMGLFANLLGRISPWRLRMGPECTGCGRCSAACRYGALEPAHLDRRRPGLTCSLCGDCLGACRHGAMNMAFPGVSPANARRAFVVLASALHALFMGVARI